MAKMTEADHRRIDELASQRLSSGRIAQMVGHHPSTVLWYMYCNGLAAPRPREKPLMYLRGTVRVHRFTDEEDTFIEALRIQDFTPAEIALHCSNRFGTERKHHSIRCRLKMLAARDDLESTRNDR